MSVFAQALGGAFGGLPQSLQNFHAGRVRRQYVGQANIEHGRSLLARASIRMANFPPPGQGVALKVTVSETEQGEDWTRDFDGHVTTSSLRFDADRGQIVEELGRITCLLSVTLIADHLHVGIEGARIAGLPVPQRLVPLSKSREWQDESGAFCFDIGAHMPGGTPLIRYVGYLVPQL